MWKGSVVIDADALRSEILENIPVPERLILTPHAGEFKRFAGSQSAREYSSLTGSMWFLKEHIQKLSLRRNIIIVFLVARF